MKLRIWFAFLAAGAVVPMVACATNDDNANVSQDGGTQISQPDAGDIDADAGDLPAVDACSDEWCGVALDGLGKATLSAAWSSPTGDTWVVGTHGFAAHFDGTSWEPRNVDTLLSLYSVWGSGPDDVWAGNSGDVMFHWQGSSWEKKQIEAFDTHAVIALGGSGPDNVLALLEQNNTQNVVCQASWGGDYAAFCPAVYRLSTVGGQLTWQKAMSDELACSTLWVKDSPYCTALGGMWVGPDGEPWLVGQEGRAFRPTAGEPRPAINPKTDQSNSIRPFDAVFGTSANDVWAVGTAGQIRHFTGGSEWATVESPTAEHLRAVWAAAPNDAWAVGDAGTIIHWDGTAWTVSEAPAQAKNRIFYSVTGTAGGEVWIAGEHVLLRHQKSENDK